MAGHQLLPQFTGELTLTVVFTLSFTSDTGKPALPRHVETSAFVLVWGNSDEGHLSFSL